MLTIGLLGPVVAWRDDVRVELAAGRTSELLARLALHPGTLVSADALIEDLWGEPTSRNTLQSKVSQLRRALGSRDVVRAEANAYALVVEPAQVDAERAAAHARAATAALAMGDAAAAADQADMGLKLFRGEALMGAGAWADADRARLTELRWALIEDLLTARVDLGAGGEVVAELERLVTEQPLRERLWAALITALYRAGRQADALAAHRLVSARLADELGIDPGPQLQALELLVLRQSPSLAGAAVARAPSAPGNLPRSAGPLLGRTDQVAQMTQLLREPGVVCVIGMPGVGKTTLALEVARMSMPPGGSWLVRLDAFDRSADLAQAVADTVHVVGGPPALLDRLRGAETLLVLDNCEHLLAQAAELAAWLADSVPLLRILATSQAPLGLPDERVLALAPLASADAVELFTQRARRWRKEFALDASTEPLVWALCQSLDGLPLAIELAAARLRSMPLAELGRRIDDRFSLLRDPSSALPERRRALEAALEWSYGLLFPDDQLGLWALCVFADGADLRGLEHVLVALGVPAAAVPDVTTRLVDRSLIGWEPDAPPAGRYRMLNSVRALAAARLADAGQAQVASAAHAAWYAQRADAVGATVRSAAQPRCLAEVRAERADVDQALAWCQEHDPATGARIVLGYGWAWVILGDGTAGAARIRAAIPPDAAPRTGAQAGFLAAWLEASAGDLAQAAADLDRADGAAAATDDELLGADARLARAFVAIQQGQPAAARAAAADALGTARRHALDWHAAAALLLGAYAALMVGDIAAARQAASQAVHVLAPLEDSWGLIHAQGILGGVADAEGRHAEAAMAFDRAAEESVRLGFPGQAALHRASWARALERAGDPSARQAYDRAIRDATSVADQRLTASTRLQLARLLRRAGDVPEARALVAMNERWYRESAGGEFALLNRALGAAIDGDAAVLEDIRNQARDAGEVAAQVCALDAEARLRAAAGDRSAAADLLAQADRLAATAPHGIDPLDRVDADDARAELRSAP